MSTAATIDAALILVVDDVPQNIHLLVSFLRSTYRIKTATTGELALKLAAMPDRPDLILLDVMMPGLSGIDVMRRLRETPQTRDIPVIFVSADTSEQSQLNGLRLGADDYLLKPVNLNILKTRVRNLLERKYAEKRLRLAAHVFAHSNEAIMITDKNNCIVEVNQAFTKLTGYALDEVKGKDPKFLSAGQTPPHVYAELWRSVERHGSWEGELMDRGKDGRIYAKWLSISVVRNGYGDIDFYIGNFTDITARKAAEQHIVHLASHDPLTELLNRFGLHSRMEQSLVQAARRRQSMAVLLLDMDRFKQINDTLGHAAGDALLVEVAHRLKATVRDADIVARLGGDEFIVVLTEVDGEEGACLVAQKMLDSLGQSYVFQGQEMHSTPSIGMALFPEDGEEYETLIRNADTAMDHAKDSGRNNVRRFNIKIAEVAAERAQLEKELHVAIEQRHFELYYQPKIEAVTNRLIGFEALLRWQHPEKGMIPPDSFIPVAEECGLIEVLGAWVLDTACRQLRIWRDMGFLAFTVAVNLSAIQLRSPRLLTDIVLSLERHQLTGSDIELEVTESVAMRDPESSIGVLQALRIMGMQLAIDDFGTGYSSLSYLKILPIHTIKLDRAFVMDIQNSPGDASICGSAIALAHSLGLKVVAEGVEQEAGRDILTRQGCDIMQGYLFSKPLPAREAEAFLHSHSSALA